MFQAIAKGMYRMGIRPNHLTLAQVPIYGIMIWEGVHGNLWAFAWWQVAIMALDGMDGTLARRMGLASRSGAYLDAAFDLFGIVVVMVVAAYAHQGYALWLILLLAANLGLYVQNWHLDEKAVSYVRGPVVIGVYLETLFPGILWVAILVPLVASVATIAVRQFVTPVSPDDDGIYRPGFSLDRPRK